MEKSLVVASGRTNDANSETMFNFGARNASLSHRDASRCRLPPNQKYKRCEFDGEKMIKQAVLHSPMIRQDDKTARFAGQRQYNLPPAAQSRDSPLPLLYKSCKFETKDTRRHAVSMLPAEKKDEHKIAVRFARSKASSQDHQHIHRSRPRQYYKRRCVAFGENVVEERRMQSASLSPSKQAAMARRRARRRVSLASICYQSCLETQTFFESIETSTSILDARSDMEKFSQKEDSATTISEDQISLSELAGLLSAQLTTAIAKGIFSPNSISSDGDRNQTTTRC
jgi:hypothetical protein